LPAGAEAEIVGVLTGKVVRAEKKKKKKSELKIERTQTVHIQRRPEHTHRELIRGHTSGAS